MPIHYALLDNGSFVYARASGVLTAQDYIEHEQALLEDDALARGYRQLLDCRWIGENLVNESVLPQLADIHSRNKAQVSGARYAVVSHSSDWFDIGAHYRCELYCMTMIVFNDPSTACVWLGMEYQKIVDYRWPDVPGFSPKQHTSPKCSRRLTPPREVFKFISVQ